MKRPFLLVLISILAFVIPQFAYAAPAVQRCEPSAEVLAGNNALYEVEPGEIVRHTWGFKNNGHCDWPPGVQLVFSEGARFSGPHAYDLPRLAPGQTANVVADLQVPASAGEHLGEWQLQTKGLTLSEKLSIRFVVTFTQMVLDPPEPDRGNGDFFQEPGPGEPAGDALIEPLFIGEVPHITLTFTPMIELAPGESASLSVECEEGIAVGAQWYSFIHQWEPNDEDAPRVYRSYGTGNSWHFGFRNPSDNVTNFYMSVGVRCLVNAEGNTFTLSGSIHLSEGAVGQAEVTCPNGSLVAGGGFDLGADTGIYLRVNDGDASANSWTVNASNYSVDNVMALAHAICYTGEDATISQVSSDWNDVDAESIGAAGATCPSGTLTTAAGFGKWGGGHREFVYYYSQPYITDLGNGWTWLIRAWNPAPSERGLYASVLCLSFD